MRSLSPQEKRTVRYAAIGLAVYLVLFFGFDTWSALQKRRAAYLRLVRDAQALRTRVEVTADKAAGLEGLMEQFRMDPAKQTTNTLIAEAVAAMHNAAMSAGIQLGPVRETASRSAARELATVQIEGVGPVGSVLGFLHGMGTLGFPLVADTVQLAPDRTQPGSARLTVTVMILNFEPWRGSKRRPDA